MTRSLESLSGPTAYFPRTASVPCVLPTLRRSRDITLLALETASSPETSRSGNCAVGHGFLLGNRRAMRATGVYSDAESSI